MPIDLKKIQFAKDLLITPQSFKETFGCCIKIRNIALLKKIIQDLPPINTLIDIAEVFDLALKIIINHEDGSKNDYTMALTFLHEQFPNLKNIHTKLNYSLLNQAAMYGKEKLVTLFLDKCDYKLATTPQNPFELAILLNRLEVVKIFFAHGADKDLPFASGLTPIAASVIYNYKEIEEFFLEQGVDTTSKNIKLNNKKLNLAELRKIIKAKNIIFPPIEEPSINNFLNVELNIMNIQASYWRVLYADNQQQHLNSATETVNLCIKTLINPVEETSLTTSLVEDFNIGMIVTVINLRILSGSMLDALYKKITKYLSTNPAHSLLINNHIASYYIYEKNYDKALPYAKQALENEIVSEAPTGSTPLFEAKCAIIKDELSRSYYNIFLIYYELDNLEKAEEYLSTVQSFFDQEEDNFNGAVLFEYYIKKKLFAEAIACFDSQVKHLLADPNATNQVITYYVHLAFYMFDIDINFTESLLDKAIGLSEDKTNIKILKEALLEFSQTTTLDDISLIGMLNMLSAEEAAKTLLNLKSKEQESTTNHLDPKLVHEYYRSLKKPIQTIFNQQVTSSWWVKNVLYTSNDESMFKVPYPGQDIYVIIEKQLLDTLDPPQQASFINTLSKGFITKAQNQNGIKIIEKKLIELKNVSIDLRLTTSVIWKNEENNQLIIFEKAQNHQAIGRTIRELKNPIKIHQCTSNEELTSSIMLEFLAVHKFIADDYLPKSSSLILSPEGFLKNIIPFPMISSDGVFEQKATPHQQISYTIVENPPFAQTLQQFNFVIKISDAIVDVARLAHQPTFYHLKSVVLSANHLAGMYFGTNIYSIAIIASKVLENIANAKIYDAAMEIAVGAALMSIPCGNIPVAYGIAIYNTYHLVDNFYHLYHQLYDVKNSVAEEVAPSGIDAFIAMQSIEVADF